ncbi:MAG: MerR family transcriptional regulator [Candidatus Omnitrophota bacterium]|nr:MerR family transcriptional regulator [Candidatus Omnitrophota bacterium]
MAYRDIYLIKDLSRMTGLSIYTIKYYLNMGLVKEVGRSSETNFRYFDNQTVDDLKRIIAYKKDNISLAKIFELMKEKSAAT